MESVSQLNIQDCPKAMVVINGCNRFEEEMEGMTPSQLDVKIQELLERPLTSRITHYAEFIANAWELRNAMVAQGICITVRSVDWFAQPVDDCVFQFPGTHEGEFHCTAPTAAHAIALVFAVALGRQYIKGVIQ